MTRRHEAKLPDRLLIRVGGPALVIVLVLFSQLVRADEVFPATSEDIRAFSSAIAESRGLSRGDSPTAARSHIIRSVVSQEAKRASDTDLGMKRSAEPRAAGERSGSLDRGSSPAHQDSGSPSAQDPQSTAKGKQHGHDKHEKHEKHEKH